MTCPLGAARKRGMRRRLLLGLDFCASDASRRAGVSRPRPARNINPVETLIQPPEQ